MCILPRKILVIGHSQKQARETWGTETCLPSPWSAHPWSAFLVAIRRWHNEWDQDFKNVWKSCAPFTAHWMGVGECVCVDPSIFFHLNCIMIVVIKTGKGVGGLGEGITKYKLTIKKTTWYRKIVMSHYICGIFCGKFPSFKPTFYGKSKMSWAHWQARPAIFSFCSQLNPFWADGFGAFTVDGQRSQTHDLQFPDASSAAGPVFISLHVTWMC